MFGVKSSAGAEKDQVTLLSQMPESISMANGDCPVASLNGAAQTLAMHCIEQLFGPVESKLSGAQHIIRT